jgi:hypothetical protein
VSGQDRLLRLDFLVSGQRLDRYWLVPRGRAAHLADSAGSLGSYFSVTHALAHQDTVDVGVHRAPTFR